METDLKRYPLPLTEIRQWNPHRVGGQELYIPFSFEDKLANRAANLVLRAVPQVSLGRGIEQRMHEGILYDTISDDRNPHRRIPLQGPGIVIVLDNETLFSISFSAYPLPRVAQLAQLTALLQYYEKTQLDEQHVFTISPTKPTSYELRTTDAPEVIHSALASYGQKVAKSIANGSLNLEDKKILKKFPTRPFPTPPFYIPEK